MELRAPPAALLARDGLHAAALGGWPAAGSRPARRAARPCGTATRAGASPTSRKRPSRSTTSTSSSPISDSAAWSMRPPAKRPSSCMPAQMPSTGRPLAIDDLAEAVERGRVVRRPGRRRARDHDRLGAAEVARLEVRARPRRAVRRRPRGAGAGARSSAPTAAPKALGCSLSTWTIGPGSLTRSERTPDGPYTPAMLDLVVSGRFALPGGASAEGEIGVADGRIAVARRSRASCSAAGAHRRPGRPARSCPGTSTRTCTRAARRARAWRARRRRPRPAASRRSSTCPTTTPSPSTRSRASSRRSRTSRPRPSSTSRCTRPSSRAAGSDEIAPLHAAGATAFKVSTFETHPVRFPRVPDGELLLAMEICAGLGALVCFHPENDDIVRRLSERLAAEGRSDPMAHADARPPVAETEAIGRALELGLATGCRTHLCHVSVERGFDLVAHALADGADASAETCTHYLVLDEDDLRAPGRARQDQPAAAPARAAGRALAPARRRPRRPGHVRPRRLGARAQGHARTSSRRARACRASRRRCRCSSARASCERGPAAGHAAARAVRGPGRALRPGAAQGSDRAGRRCRPRRLRSRRALAHRRGASSSARRAGARTMGVT